MSEEKPVAAEKPGMAVRVSVVIVDDEDEDESSKGVVIVEEPLLHIFMRPTFRFHPW